MAAQFTRDDVARLSVECGLGQFAARLGEVAARGARLEPSPGSPGLGDSKIGGLPDLPPGVDWPSAGGEVSTFVVQIALSDVPSIVRTELPDFDDGLLSFFAFRARATGEVVGGAVLRVPFDHSLRRVPAPHGQDYDRVRGERGLILRPELTLPRWTAYDSAGVRTLGLSEADRDAYDRLRRAVSAAQGVHPPFHRFLGHPEQMVDDVLTEAALLARWDGGGDEHTPDELEREATDWRLLLRIDSDGETGIRWPGGGTVYFCMRADDLRMARYESAQALTQQR